jgi:hypothetical protein
MEWDYDPEQDSYTVTMPGWKCQVVRNDSTWGGTVSDGKTSHGIFTLSTAEAAKAWCEEYLAERLGIGTAKTV